MTRFATAFLATLAPISVAAHDGLHHHPHGIESHWLAIAIVGSVVGCVAVAAKHARRK